MKISEFYNQDNSVNKASLEFCKLHRYYVFKKRALDKKKSVEIKKIQNKTKSKGKLKESIKVKKPGLKNNLIEKYLNSGNVIDI